MSFKRIKSVNNYLVIDLGFIREQKYFISVVLIKNITN